MQDREQKQAALRLSAARRWLPQLEIDVRPGRALGPSTVLVTDLDVFASIPDEFRGFRSVVFDCKTRAKESPVNRAFWLAGVLQRMNAEQGFCILRRDEVEVDHRLMATRLNVTILTEDELSLYARTTTAQDDGCPANVGNIELWERVFEIPNKYPKLKPLLGHLRSKFWMIEDSAEACRKTLAAARDAHGELDPERLEHIVLYFDLCAIFARALAVVVCQIFRAYLHPKSHADLSDALRVIFYGGREAYDHRNELYKRAKAKMVDEPVADELALPEWEQFLKLARQLLDAPLAFQRTPLILREIGFSALAGDNERPFAKLLCAESAQATRFAILVNDYVCKAARLSPEFGRRADELLLSMVTVK